MVKLIYLCLFVSCQHKALRLSLFNFGSATYLSCQTNQILGLLPPCEGEHRGEHDRSKQMSQV